MSNKIITYSLESAEKTVLNVMDMSVPLVIKFEDPINRIDDIMCKSLDVVEQNVPMVTYTPEEVSAFKISCYIQIMINKTNYYFRSYIKYKNTNPSQKLKTRYKIKY